ncbi:NADH-quinone oxidoreductase subunit C [Paenibacillus sp. ACRRX]|uniref:NADH-quinone oxidoreductase subunit C n=1 Tax=Paenibacillus sp. ACRRX TaxID=2918206 RepID=UPI001EF681A5|nr:NADH-quinone oxidoreductase subunit C [Paenibacillus sp. ACRRX]MCG7408030.1 NADH-quinone oxidoreductase subunit C [Paenibacillus sp. ACRRX]
MSEDNQPTNREKPLLQPEQEPKETVHAVEAKLEAATDSTARDMNNAGESAASELMEVKQSETQEVGVEPTEGKRNVPAEGRGDAPAEVAQEKAAEAGTQPAERRDDAPVEAAADKPTRQPLTEEEKLARVKAATEAKAARATAAAGGTEGEGAAEPAAATRPARAPRAPKAEEPEQPKVPSPKQPLLDRLVEQLQADIAPDAVEASTINETDGHMPTVTIKEEHWYKTAQWLRHNPEWSCDYLRNLSGVDQESYLAVVYHLISLKTRMEVAVHVKTDREQPSIASVTPIWPTADWNERETYDLFGISFPGHPNLRRIMMSDDWVGYPLRKDYEQLDSEV